MPENPAESKQHSNALVVRVQRVQWGAVRKPQYSTISDLLFNTLLSTVRWEKSTQALWRVNKAWASSSLCRDWTMADPKCRPAVSKYGHSRPISFHAPEPRHDPLNSRAHTHTKRSDGSPWAPLNAWKGFQKCIARYIERWCIFYFQHRHMYWTVYIGLYILQDCVQFSFSVKGYNSIWSE